MSQASQTRQRKRQGATKESVGDIAKRQVGEGLAIAQQAVVSGTWAYPLYGIIYLLRHPSLIRPLLPTLVKGVLVSIAVVAGLFFLTYLPQVAFLALFSGPLAFIAAVPLILGEAYVIINVIARNFLLGQVGVDLFDAVLLLRGQTALVEKGRQVTTSGTKGKQLGRMLTKPFNKLSTENVVRYLLSLPLNLIPVVGTAFFVAYNGYKAGPGYHARYFQLKGYDKDQRQAAIARRRGSYSAFGVVATLLNLIPVVSILFNFTSTVGAALWAAELETKGKGSAGNPLHEPDQAQVSISDTVHKDL